MLALTGCEASEDKPAAVKEKADTSVAETPAGDTADDAADDDASVAPVVVEEEPEQEAAGTAALGDLVTVGDWDVKVTEVVMDAAAPIHKANQFNEKAKGKYVLVTYEATYNGAERTADALWDLTWTFTGTDSQVNETASVVTPADDQSWPTEARKGGTVKGQVAFDLDPAITSGGLLTVEGYDANYDTVYADFMVA